MTITPNRRLGRHATRRTFRAASATTPSNRADGGDLVSGLPMATDHSTQAMRTVLSHTSSAWNSLRHAC